jgi:pimeloyl-ACP methyl ester carboxylesterase
VANREIVGTNASIIDHPATPGIAPWIVARAYNRVRVDAPRVQYARTTDGINIPYLDMGSGPPIVFASHIYGDAHLYQVKGWYPQIIADGLQQAGWRVVMYDVRGMGLSDKPVTDVSLTARVKDLHAVVAQLGLQRFVLLGADHGAATAVAFAARNADLISQLVLVEPYALSEKYALAAPRLMGAVAAATDEEWRMWANVVAEIVTGFRASELSRRLGAAIRSSTTPDQLRAYFRETELIDLRDDLARVEAPTLVISTGLPVGSLQLCRDVATRIAHSSFVTMGTGSAWEVIDPYLRSCPQPLDLHPATT